MNERIKKIVEQTTQEFSPAFEIDKWQEKFAKLIVKECAHIADLADENKCEWIGGNILTHFGVKE